MMNEAQFIELAARKLAGEATPAELRELEELLQQEGMRERYQLFQQYFSAPEGQVYADTELALERTLEKIRRPQESAAGTTRIVRRRWPAYAAAAVMTGVIIFFLFIRPDAPEKSAPVAQALQDTAQWLNRQNGKATRAVIELADGSKIWLNAESKLSYPEVFSRNSREVYLNGEAFFDVAADQNRPFIIHLAKGTVKVLGTSFNVRAYDNEPVQTSVTTGKVAFIPKYENGSGRADTFYITPDQKVTYSRTAEDVVKESTSGEDDKAWTEGRLVFRNESLEEIGRELERTFGKKVIFQSDAPKHFRMTGSFQNNNLQDILFYLARSRPFKYTVTDSTLLIEE